MKRFLHPTKNLLMGGVIVPAGEWFQWDHDFIPDGCTEIVPQQTVETVYDVIPAVVEVFQQVNGSYPVAPDIQVKKKKKT